jgi:spermidine/putrescine transport system ATP-binding protein
VKAIDGGIALVETARGALRGRAAAGLSTGSAARLYVRPEALRHDGEGDNRLSATIERIDFEGAFALAYGKLDDGTPLVASIASTDLGAAPPVGSPVSFAFRDANAVVLPDV